MSRSNANVRGSDKRGSQNHGGSTFLPAANITAQTFNLDDTFMNLFPGDISPRFYQRPVLEDLVRTHVTSSREEAAEGKAWKSIFRLIQHPTGTGNLMGMIALTLAQLWCVPASKSPTHIYDKILLVADRRELVSQIFDKLRQIAPPNMQYDVPSSIKKLRKSLTTGRSRIIITSVQKVSNLTDRGIFIEKICIRGGRSPQKSHA